MRTKRTIITKQLWLSRPVYTEGKRLLSGLDAEDMRLITESAGELPEGKLFVSTSKRSGYRLLTISVATK